MQCKYHLCSNELTGKQQSFCSPSCKLKYHVKRRRTKLKEMAVEHKGGKCECCGYDRTLHALQFHHLDPNEKDFGVSAKGYTRSWEKVKAEIEKCILVCANCHAEIHAGIRNP